MGQNGTHRCFVPASCMEGFPMNLKKSSLFPAALECRPTITAGSEPCLHNLFSPESSFHSQVAACHCVGMLKRKKQKEKENRGKKRQLNGITQILLTDRRFLFPHPTLQINPSQTKHHYDAVRQVSSRRFIREGWAKPPAS